MDLLDAWNKLKIGGAKQANADSDPKHYSIWWTGLKYVYKFICYSTYICTYQCTECAKVKNKKVDIKYIF